MEENQTKPFLEESCPPDPPHLLNAYHQSNNLIAGWYMEPAVFTNVQDGTFIAKEESFGPIMVISKFSNG